MSGIALVILFIVCIVTMVVAISKFKIHPFLAILATALLFAILSGAPLNDVKEGTKLIHPGLANVFQSGFAATFKGIGLVIVFGALIGSILEATGAALKIADTVVKWLGPKHPELAMLIMGWIVSIPVFCDSGYIILNPIRKALKKRTGRSAAAMAVCLSAGLYAAHVFIPPTPGPIAAASSLNVNDNLLQVMLFGTIISIPTLAVAYLYAKYLSKRMEISEDREDAGRTYEEIKASYGELPSAFLSFLPILLPFLLMALGSVSAALHWKGVVPSLLKFVGTPVVALAWGLITALFLLPNLKTGQNFRQVCEQCLKTTGPILLITAAGGILGRVISESGLIAYIKDNATLLSVAGIFFPFLLSAILKTAQGSSTVALVTTASLMAPMMTSLGLATPNLRVLTVLAIGAGAMTVSHANDSYFWVVSNFSGMTTEQGYRSQTVVTLLEGVVAMLSIWILSFILH